MFTISKTQMNAIETSYRKQRRQRLAVDFRKSYPSLVFEKSDQQLIEYVDIVIEDCKELGIAQDADILDCAAIGFLLKKPVCNNEVIALVTRTLNNQAWNARKRLDFIWTHILPPNCAD